MLKFFQKIRRDLASEGNSKKYFKYAIGEIILVVIGILIALQINNANENRKRYNLKQNLLVELKESIMQDTVALNDRREQLISAFINAIHLHKVIKKDLPYSTSLDSSFAKIEMVSAYESDYKTMERLLNVGIEIIDNNTLVEELMHYYEDSENTATVGDRTKKILSEQIYPKYFTLYYRSIKAVPEDFEVLKKANEFKIALDYSITASRFLIKRSIHRVNLAKEILKMLDEEITIKMDTSSSTPYIKDMSKDSIDIKNQIEELKKIIGEL